MPNHYHLAQVNIGRAVAPMDSPAMAGFVSQLAPVNALADRSPGFVWRLQSESGNATDILPYDDPSININMSVWESVEALKEFVYKSGHIVPLRDRLKWFEKPVEAHMAMWWIPAGHIPTVEEAKERLQFRRTRGDTPVAFSFSSPFPAPEAPLGQPDFAVSAAIDVRGLRVSLGGTPILHGVDLEVGSGEWVTVIGPNVYEADRFATAAFAMGRKGIEFIEKLVDFEGYMIDAQARATFTSGFERYVLHQ